MQLKHQNFVYDFTSFQTDLSPDVIINNLKTFCKKYCFQKEECPLTGKLHYQGRISLKNKMLIGEIIFML